MHLIEFITGFDPLSMGIALLLVLIVVAYGWFEIRRNSRLPHIGMVLIKNRLKSTRQFPHRRR